MIDDEPRTTKTVWAQPCKSCLKLLAELGLIAPVRLDCADCQMKVNQALRVIATRPEFAFAIALPGR
jgi:hypothetical protein